MKTCSKCGFIGEDNLFIKDRNLCKQCQKERSRNYYLENTEKIKVKTKIWKKDNPEKVKISNRKSDKKSRQNNPEKYKIKNKKWKKENPDKVSKTKNKSHAKKCKSDPIFRLMRNCSRLVNKMLKLQNSSKNGKSSKSFFPFTTEELKKHIELLFEPWMNWSNQGEYNSKIWNDNDSTTWTWQLDHILPQSDYTYSSMEDSNFKIVWVLSNLRPLSAKQNIIDGANRIRHKKINL